MKADDIFATSDGFFPHDVGACGPFLSTRLLPFSLWHSWVLRVLENPYVIGGEPKKEDLIQALFVCSKLRYDLAMIVSKGTFQEKILSMAEKFSACTNEEFKELADSFSEYLEQSFMFPEYWETEESKTSKYRLRVPFEWRLVQNLLSMRICKDESEAWDYSIQRATCWSAVLSDVPGGAEMVDAKDKEDRKKLEALKDG